MAETLEGTNQIQGWGADLDPANRMGIPKERPSDVQTPYGEPRVGMKPPFRIHQSIEHAKLTPVFGTSCPPKGLSGWLRDFGYQFGEGRLARWMTLILADRVDVVEGLLGDLARGHVPNIFRERGWRAELTHADKERRVRTVLMAGVTAGALTTGLVLLAKRRRSLR